MSMVIGVSWVNTTMNHFLIYYGGYRDYNGDMHQSDMQLGMGTALGQSISLVLGIEYDIERRWAQV